MTNFIFENTWEENQEALKTKKLAIIPVGSSEQHGPAPVSYTHLDVYKRQGFSRANCRWQVKMRKTSF